MSCGEARGVELRMRKDEAELKDRFERDARALVAMVAYCQKEAFRIGSEKAAVLLSRSMVIISSEHGCDEIIDDLEMRVRQRWSM